MIEFDKIRMVHVEASSRCNSHCPMCSRYTGHGHLQPDLTEGDLSADIFYKLFTKEFAGQLEHVYFSGVYGDPCLNKLLPEFVNYLIDNGCKSVSIDTNGGYRGEDWWASLARPGVLINFAVDGTDNETLGRYRIGVSYDKVYANLRAYVAAGGEAQWNFIVFKHNEHQVDTAKQLAEEIGVKFRLKITQKFRGRKDFKVMVKGQQVSTLEPPEQEEFRHTNIGNAEHIPNTLFKFDIKNYTKLNQNKITCKSLERQEVYLAANGLLMPCCYLGTHTHDSPGAWNLNNNYDLTQFDLAQHSVESILSKLYRISDKWNDTIENGNLITCLHTCGNTENTTLYHSDVLSKENILKIK
jgi:MoaA/NifB/PqqE/SkfB family radical SAM enzyme